MLMASSLLTSMLLNLCSYWGYLASDWGSPSSSLNFLRPQSSTSSHEPFVSMAPRVDQSGAWLTAMMEEP